MLKNLLTFWLSLKSNQKSLILFVFIVWCLTRFIGLSSFLTVDEPTWVGRSSAFLNGIATFKLDQTFQAATEQAAHPGVLPMWLGSFGIIIKIIVNNFIDIPLPLQIGLIKIPLIIFEGLIFTYSVYLLSKLFNEKFAFIFSVLAFSEPFFTAHTRLLHLDGILSLLMFASVLSIVYFFEKKNRVSLLLSAVFAGLAFATKIPSFALIPFVFGCFLVYRKKRFINEYLVWILIAGAVLISIWPALWVEPVKAISSLFGAATKGISLSHSEKKYVLDAIFYPRSLLYYLNPLTIISAVISIFLLTRDFIQKKVNKPTLIFIVFAAYFIFGMTLGAKKGERYILPSYLFIDFLACWIFYKLNKWWSYALLVLSFVYCLSFSPYYISYINPFAKEPEKIGLGEGLEIAAEYLNSKQDSTNLQVSTWYSNVFSFYFKGKIVDLNRREEESIDYVILYRNMRGREIDDPATSIIEEYSSKRPEKVIYINNIEYVWIYKK